MRIHAYQEIYLSKAQSVLGDAFDYAVNICGFPGNDFVKMFIVSSVSKRMENGDVALFVGKSGIEIVRDVVEETTGRELETAPQVRFDRSREYWIGRAVAYYQWVSDRKFWEIFEAMPFEVLWRIYNPLHEADITKFVDVADRWMRERFPETNLRRMRDLHGFTQAELAEKADVSLHSIQSYEQRDISINQASAETLYRLAKTLDCSMEDLIEK